ncbi:SpoIIE family protein phosphatase [Streptomyces sp. AC627_RSS907]|uniref:SpoIIE family protein phosphatase n=1 Tax=Streptomyces sp. AC627_RSS907 TaxID=2823684 RepID=UPI0027E4203B|nr:SpoIIE family protein phosphatase [Streptomyces sp. AC627_RSS907]
MPEVPIGPPLGLGGLPFETTEFELPENSLLVLHTDGLIAGRTRDMDLGLAALHDVLTSAPDSLEEICDWLLAALLPGRPADDVACSSPGPTPSTRTTSPRWTSRPIRQPCPGPAASPPTSWRPGSWKIFPSPRSWSSANW